MTEAIRVLLIDDDRDFHNLLQFLLAPHGIDLVGGLDLHGALEALGDAAPEAILLDRDLDGVDGVQHIPELAVRLPGIPVVLITGHSGVDEVVRAMKAGAFDFISKPVEEARLLATLLKAAEIVRLRRELKTASRSELSSCYGMIGGSREMRTVYEIIKNVAATDASVFICGESGTGKELVAQAIHAQSPRKRRPVVSLNMAGLHRELVESTLFGHEKGAFTGAERRHEGACREAEGGTLFLDELAEMPIDLQPKLLRFLQERIFRPVGAARDVVSDVRVVSATNRDPLEEVEAGRLRLDLYYRLNVVPIRLPALRERRSDIPLLAVSFLKELSKNYDKDFESFAPDAMERLQQAPWPGNVRQLRHAVERVVILNAGSEVTSAMLPDDLAADPTHLSGVGHSPGVASVESALRSAPIPVAPVNRTPVDPPGRVEPEAPRPGLNEPLETPGGGILEAAVEPKAPRPEDLDSLALLERRAIEHAISVCSSVAEASERLGISEATIYRRLRQYEEGEVASP